MAFLLGIPGNCHGGKEGKVVGSIPGSYHFNRETSHRSTSKTIVKILETAFQKVAEDRANEGCALRWPKFHLVEKKIIEAI